MKRLIYFLLLSISTSFFFSSCSNTKTYAELLNDESMLIKAFIKRNNIRVLSTFPKDSDWKANDYVLTASGLYFHLVTPGDSITSDTLQLKDVVVPRFKQYTLDAVSDTISNWSTIDYPYPSTFVYGDYTSTSSCSGFQEAVSYMKRNDSEAKLIIPSKLGFSTYLSSVTPLGYDLKIRIQK